MRSNLRQNIRLTKNILRVISAFVIALKIANFNNYSRGHISGEFLSENMLKINL